MQNRALVCKFVSLALASLWLLPLKATAQCSCTHLACEICVQTTLPAIDAGTQAAFQALDVSIEAAEQALSAGIQAEILAIRNYRENVVGGIEANAYEKSQAVVQSREVEIGIMEAFKNAKARIEKKDFVARNNLYTDHNFGWRNVAYPAKLMFSSQNTFVVDAEGEATETKADVPYLLSNLNKKLPVYLNKILKTDADVTGDSIDGHRVLRFLTDGGMQQSIIRSSQMPEAIAARRMIVSPPGVQRGQRGEDAKTEDQQGYWRTISRVKSAAEAMAFDLALRDEVITEEGRTSILHLLRNWTDRIYRDTEGIKDLSTAEMRELKQWIATNHSLSNFLDLLLVEIDRYRTNLEAAKIGFMTEYAFDSGQGYIELDNYLDGTVDYDNQ